MFRKPDKAAFWRADSGVTKQDASRWRRSNPQPLHALCLVRPLSRGGKLRNVRPALKVAYATTNIIVFCKTFYKNPSGVKSATQNLHNKGKPGGRDTGQAQHSDMAEGLPGWSVAFSTQAVVQHLVTRSRRREHGSQGLGESNGCGPSGRSLSLANYPTLCDMCLRVTAWAWCRMVLSRRRQPGAHCSATCGPFTLTPTKGAFLKVFSLLK